MGTMHGPATARGLRAVVAAALAMTLLAACGGGEAAEPGGGGPVGEPQRGGTLVYSWNSDAQSLDPARCGQNLNWGVCQALFGTLLVADPTTGEFSPGMAESFSSEDGVTWTLSLREGVTFSDGTPFDAEAVVFNWDRARDPANLSPGASIANSMTYEVVDPLTMRVRLQRPNFQLPWALYSELAFIGSPTAIRERGADFANSPVGGGPFTFDSWTRGTRLTLLRNGTYWDQPRPYVDRLEFAVIGSDDQRLNALRSGETTVMATVTDEYAERAVQEGYVDHTLQHLGGVGVRVNHRHGALADPAIRLAVGKLIDAQQVTDAFYDGVPGAATFAEPGSPWFDPEAVFPEQDVAGAQQLVDAYRARTGGAEVVITYKLVGGIPLQDQVAQMLQAQVQRVQGLRLEIVPLDSGAFVGDLNSGNYELMLAGINGINPDLLYLLFHTGESQNNAGFSDPAVDAALERARSRRDPAEQRAAYQEAMRGIAAGMGHRSWRYQRTHLVADDTVHGIVPQFSYYLLADQVWMEQG